MDVDVKLQMNKKTPPRPRSRNAAAGMLLAGWAAVSWGCVSTNPRSDFDQIARDAASRSGVEAPAWPGDPASRPTHQDLAREILAATQPLTADAAARIAWLLDPGLHADLEDLGVARADLAQAARLPNPGFGVSLLRPESGGSHSLELDLGWRFLDALLLPARRRLAAVQYEAIKLRVGDRLLAAAARARTAFFEAQAAAQRRHRIELVADLDASGAEVAARLRAAGNLPEYEVLQRRSMAHESQAALLVARGEEAEAIESLALVLGLGGDGQPLPTLDLGRQLPDLPAVDEKPEGLEQQALAERLDLGAARFGVEALTRALGQRRGTRFLPMGVEIGVSREREIDGTKLSGPHLRVGLPLFDTGKASIAHLESELRRSRYQLDALTLRARSEVRSAHARLSNARERVTLLRETVLPERIRLLDETLRRYNMMLVGVFDLLHARRAELQAENELIDAWRDYWLAHIDLERATGGALRASPAPQDSSRYPDPSDHSNPSDHSTHGDSHP